MGRSTTTPEHNNRMGIATLNPSYKTVAAKAPPTNSKVAWISASHGQHEACPSPAEGQLYRLAYRVHSPPGTAITQSRTA